MAGRSCLSLLLAGVSALFATTAGAQPFDPRTFDPALREFDERYYRERPPRFRDVRRPVTGRKYCSIYVPDNWRDSFPVPDAWSWSDCRDFAAAVGATRVHLVCVFADGQRPAFSIGGPGDLPNPDCGWGARR
ncbi:MAG TPA: hypothetical protein VHG30_10770 [Microvirga sp.]|jgi:hypothetical protein|nr:hypothetical protein [Microvirga sp.]